MTTTQLLIVLGVTLVYGIAYRFSFKSKKAKERRAESVVLAEGFLFVMVCVTVIAGFSWVFLGTCVVAYFLITCIATLGLALPPKQLTWDEIFGGIISIERKGQQLVCGNSKGKSQIYELGEEGTYAVREGKVFLVLPEGDWLIGGIYGLYSFTSERPILFPRQPNEKTA